jgi:3-methyladenine DNA glycosylase AlkD
MQQLEQLIARVGQTQHGFTDIRQTARELAVAATPERRQELAAALLSATAYQARMLATFLLGDLAAEADSACATLRHVVSHDPDWRVQETLAQAFDTVCATRGYVVSLPLIEAWLSDQHANVRRAVTEGLRIWTSRPYFREHPEHAVELLSPLHVDNSQYVRRSVGNALRDISRKHPELVRKAITGCDAADRRAVETAALARKFLNQV